MNVYLSLIEAYIKRSCITERFNKKYKFIRWYCAQKPVLEKLKVKKLISYIFCISLFMENKSWVIQVVQDNIFLRLTTIKSRIVNVIISSKSKGSYGW